MLHTLLAITLAIAPGTITVDGMDGVVTMSDTTGAVMVVNADCARVIVDSGITVLADIHRNGVTSTAAYIEACF